MGTPCSAELLYPATERNLLEKKDGLNFSLKERGTNMSFPLGDWKLVWLHPALTTFFLDDYADQAAVPLEVAIIPSSEGSVTSRDGDLPVCVFHFTVGCLNSRPCSFSQAQSSRWPRLPQITSPRPTGKIDICCLAAPPCETPSQFR